MRLFVNITIFLFLLAAVELAEAQTELNTLDNDTLKYKLKQVEVYSSRLNDFKKPNLKKVDSGIIENSENENLANLINKSSSFDIKTYGIPGIATASNRGVSAYHNPVIINGFNIQDPLNGGVDLNLIPAFFIDEAYIKSGGGSSLFGSGAIGGSIHLNNKNSFNKGFSLKTFANASTTYNLQGGLAVNYSTKKFSNSTKFVYTDNKNKFNYVNNYVISSPLEKQQNAKQLLNGFMQSNSFIIKNNMKLNSNLWYIHSDKQVPSRLDQNNSYQSQTDKSFRYTLDYNIFKGDNKFTFRNAFFYNDLIYNKSDIDLNATHASFTYVSEFEAGIKIRENDILNFGLNHQYISSTSSSLTDNPEINSSSIFALYRLKLIKNTNIKAAIRSEMRNAELKTPSFEITTDYKPDKFRFWLSVSTNYRMPTLNDLYWNDAFSKGNINLKDEQSESGELGIAYKSKKFDFNLSVYNTQVHNMILWSVEGDYWTPSNKKEVLSQGIETGLKYKKDFGKIKFMADFSYSYNSSINNDKSGEFYQNQIIYAPKNKASAIAIIDYRGFSISYNQKFTGERYLNDENTKTLKAFYPADFSVSYQHKLKEKSKFKYNFRINNIYNHNYVVMPAYPMPLRFFEFGIKYCLN